MKKNIYVLLLVIIQIAFINKQVYAKEKLENNFKDFTYSIKYPENQTDESLGYFDLSMNAGNNQSIFVEVSNRSNKELTIVTNLNSAKTNERGQVEYGPNNIKNDDSLKIDIKDILDLPEKVIIPPKKTEEIKININVPSDAKDGIIVGGLQLKIDNELDENVNTAKDNVLNEFAYLLGIVLRIGNTTSIQPEIQLKNLYVSENNGKSALFLSISNIQAVYAEDLNLSMSVGKVNKSKSIFDYTQSNIRMAPNTNLNLPIDLSDKQLSSGNYEAYIKIKLKNGEVQSWSQKFDISSEEAAQIKQDNRNDDFWTTRSNLIIVLFCILVIIIFYLRFKRLNRRE